MFAMRAKVKERAKARTLRGRGWSLRRIANELDVSLTSVSVWVRDVASPASPPPPPATTPSRKELPKLSGEEFRRCKACERVLPLTAFNRHPRGHQWRCRECFREYFCRRGSLHRRQSAEAKKRRAEKARAFVLSYLADHPCVECGEGDPVVLEFDHVGEKRCSIAVMVAQAASPAAVAREIQRCEVVCVNCHRRRTAHRAGWRRGSPDWRLLPSARTANERRSMEWVYRLLERSSCVDCGCSDPLSLDFDHLGGKTGHIGDLARSGYSVPRLKLEIAQCEVRCGNCHRRRTAEVRGYYRHQAA